MNATLRNEMIDLLNSAGLYRVALGAEPSTDESRGVPGALLALIQINLAEADYNLGHWDEAEERLAGLDSAARQMSITRAGLLQQRAWIAAHEGRAAEAMELCEQVSIHWLPAHYHAEYHFTRAAALLGLERYDDAEAEVLAAERVARRPSSKRNALFLLARIAAGHDDWASAEALCRQAASHPYRSQGGDGLLLWGDALLRIGTLDEAERAWRLAVERDPESESARIAAVRLGNQ